MTQNTLHHSNDNLTETIAFHANRGCLSYLVFDPRSRDAILIDPSSEIGLDAYLDVLVQHSLHLKYILETHTHADHISLASEIRNATNAEIVRHSLAPSKAHDVSVRDGDILRFGQCELKILVTPGHTNESICIVTDREVFTGDTLLIGSTGRTDFQVGDSRSLFHSLHSVLAKLSPEIEVRPGHDYKGRSKAILREEFRTNPRLQLNENDFVELMDAHHPPKPDLFSEAIAQNSK